MNGNETMVNTLVFLIALVAGLCLVQKGTMIKSFSGCHSNQFSLIENSVPPLLKDLMGDFFYAKSNNYL